MYRKDKKKEYYTEKARQEGYVARSVYKLQEIDKKYRIFKKGARVLDLGAAPGSWMQYIQKQIGPKGLVVGVDKVELAFTPKPPAVFIQEDVFNLNTEDLERFAGFSAQGACPSEAGRRRARPTERRQSFGRGPASGWDVVVSDLAPATSGAKALDSGRSFELAALAFQIALSLLLPKGSVVIKVFESESVIGLISEMRKHFSFVKRFRPKAVRPESREIYIIATGFQGDRK